MISFFRALFLFCRLLTKVRFSESGYSVTFSTGAALFISYSGSVKLDLPKDARVNAECFLFNCDESLDYKQMQSTEVIDYAQEEIIVGAQSRALQPDYARGLCSGDADGGLSGVSSGVSRSKTFG